MSVETVETAPTWAELPGKGRAGRVKLVAWDLDNTLWDGVLLEGDELRLREDVVQVIRDLDELGVLHSVVSRNDPEQALARLRAFGLEEYFLYPQIGWNAKSSSIAQIAKSVNIDVSAIAFVDDQAFELAEVAHALPQVVCVDVADLAAAVRQPEFRPRFVTAESARRREMYRQQIVRDDAEKDFVGPGDEFLSSLEMVFTIAAAREEDLQRAEELTIRTNQLNSTGRTYSYEELDALRSSGDHLLLTAALDDRFGTYGTIGLCLVEKGATAWHLRLLLMSCRVVSRGVGTILLNHVIGLARAAGVPLRADFVETGRNRMMQITYAFAGFEEVDRDGSRVTLEQNSAEDRPQPAFVTVLTDDVGADR
jgi:FkbH-like protein